MAKKKKLRTIKPRKWRSILWGAFIWEPTTHFFTKMTDWPVIGKYARAVHNKQHYDVTFIPINEKIEAGGSTIVPKQIVEEWIRKSSARLLLPICICRTGCGCEEHSRSLGCLFLGEGVKDADPSMGKLISADEAVEHMNTCIDSGLIPQIGRVDADPLMLGIQRQNWRKFLTLCFCCTCCCIAMRNMERWSPKVKDLMHTVEGLNIDIGDDCNGCGKCVTACFTGAISLNGDRAERNPDICKGCGICVDKCPQNAISITIEDGNRMFEAVREKLEWCADVE